jgi:phage portal protein BeeE
LDRATFSNIEHQGIEFVVYSIRPRLVRWEQRILTDLVPPAEQATIYAEFLVDGLLRGDLLSRYQAYAVGRNNGWLSANDVLELENRNLIANGDIYLQPVNMVEAGAAPDLTPQGRLDLIRELAGGNGHHPQKELTHA